LVETAGTAIANGRSAGARGFAARRGDRLARLGGLFAQSFETEVASRRMFLWLPVAAGSGVVAYLCADREPSLWMLAPLAATLAGIAFLVRSRRIPFMLLCGLAAFFAGKLSAAWRSARVAAPIIHKVTIGPLMALSSRWISAAAAPDSS
jgi:competence protein ComEC